VVSLQGLVAICAAVPATTLIWAGDVKLWNPGPASVALTRFGLVKRIRRSTARAAGGLELVAGGTLVTFPYSPAAYALPIGLLVLFTSLLARVVTRGETFSCACFGASDEPIGPSTLARTATMLALAAFALLVLLVARPDESAPATRFAVSAAVVLALATVSLATAIRATRPFAD